MTDAGSKSTRRYEAPARRQKAEALRETILQTAKRLFVDQGFGATTITQIAAEAGCSEAKIYAAFASKAGVFVAILEAAAFGDAYQRAVASAAAQSDPVARLRSAARIARTIYQSERESFVLMRGIGSLSADLARWEQELEDRRFERQGPVVRGLARDGALAPGLEEMRARQILWALTSRELFRQLVIERCWPLDDYERWLGDLLASQLLA